MPAISQVHCLLRHILSFIKYLFTAYYVPGTVLGAGGITVNKTAKPLPSGTPYSSQSRETTNKQKSVHISRMINVLRKSREQIVPVLGLFAL